MTQQVQLRAIPADACSGVDDCTRQRFVVTWSECAVLADDTGLSQPWGLSKQLGLGAVSLSGL